jgi:hypothetical protein
MMKPSSFLRVIAGAMLIAVAGGAVAFRVLAARHAKNKVLGLNRVIAFAYSPGGDFSVKQLHSITLVGPVSAGDWKYWQSRKVVTAVGHTWFDLLRSPVEKAVDNLTGQDFGGNPRPVVMIDEFGFDFGGGMDEKSAQILRQAKLKKPDLALAVWDMRGPIPKVLAEAYRDVADLVMMESYVENQKHYWFIASQAWSARRYGILPKTIFVLGVGKGQPGENWAQTKEELEEQIRFVRMIAPESPGIGFFSGTPELLTDADALSAHFFDYPTNGSGLPAEVRDLARTFSRHYDKPTLAASPSFVEPNYLADGSGGLAQPATLRAYLINLGDADAVNVKVRLRNPANVGGNVFAEGVVPLIPKRSEAIGVLAVTSPWRAWVGGWILEVESPGCDVLTFKP